MKIQSEEILAHLFVKVCEKPLTNTGESYIIYRQHDDKAVLHGARASVNMSMEKYSRGRRGAPAKGVGRVNRRESSNLSFSAR